MLDALFGGLRARPQPDGRLLLVVGSGAQRRVLSVSGGPLTQFSLQPLSGGWQLMMTQGEAAPVELARFDDGTQARRALRRIATALAGSSDLWSWLRWGIAMIALGAILILEFIPISGNVDAAEAPGQTAPPPVMERPPLTAPYQSPLPGAGVQPPGDSGGISRGIPQGGFPAGPGRTPPQPAPQQPVAPTVKTPPNGADSFGLE